MESVKEKVNYILVEKIGIPASEITPEANFTKDLGIDSLDYAELVMEFEQTFKIRIPDEMAGSLKTVKNAVQYIENEISLHHIK